MKNLIAAVRDAAGTMVYICGFVVFFLVLLRVMGRVTGLSHPVLSGAVELTQGILALPHTRRGFVWAAGLLGWGGLSVQGQLSAALGDGRLLDGSFYLYRVLHGVASGLLALLLFRLIPAGLPTAVGTLGGGVAALPYPVTAAASGMLLVLSFLAMVCFSPKSTGKTE